MASQPVERLAIGIDLGGTQLRAALVDRNGAIQARAAEKTKANAGPDAVTSQIAKLAGKVAEGMDLSSILGVGVSSPGPLDTVEGMALAVPTLAGFVNFPLREALATALGMPVTLENDGISAAIGEWRYGAGRGLANIVYVTVSTGIGGGVIAGNKVLRGRRGMAGHVGHMSFVRGGVLCVCGGHGCFEAYGSGTAFTKRAIEAAANDTRTSIGKNGEPIDAAAVFNAAAGGDPLALALVEEEAAILGEGFASLFHLYSPDALIMGGGLSNQFDVLHEGVAASARRSAMPPFKDTPILRAALGMNSGLIGAASLAFDTSDLSSGS